MTTDWRSRAACRPAAGEFIGAPDSVMFPSRPAGNWRNTDDLWAAAKAVCRPCPVAAECLGDALDDEADGAAREGMRGGKTPDERKAVASAAKRKARTQAFTTTGDCGTTRGYRAHLRRGEQGCPDCRRAAARDRRAGERKRAAA